jgi:hypothetical protein
MVTLQKAICRKNTGAKNPFFFILFFDGLNYFRR